MNGGKHGLRVRLIGTSQELLRDRVFFEYIGIFQQI
jgi:hypothetical protein